MTGCVGSPFGNLLVMQNKKGYGINRNPFVFSGAEGDRTPDLLSAIQARSQLRHSPVDFCFMLS